MRDSQRSLVYDTEHALCAVFDNAQKMDSPHFDFFGSVLNLPVERKFGSVESVQSYVDRILALNWVISTWGWRGPVSVRARKGQSKAHYCRGEIAVPVGAWNRWALREIVVLHEIAHHLTPLDPGHGPDFAGTHHALVTEIIGPEAGLLFSWTQDTGGVERNFKKVLVGS